MEKPPMLQLVPTKQEEIEFLDILSKTIPRSSYLKHLFTTQLVMWVADRIQADILPDIMAEYIADSTKAMKQIADRREQYGRMQRLYDRNINLLQRRIRVLEEEIADGNATKDVGEKSYAKEKQSANS